MRFLFVIFIFLTHLDLDVSLANSGCEGELTLTSSRKVESLKRSWIKDFGDVSSFHYLMRLQKLIIEDVNVGKDQFLMELNHNYGKSLASAPKVISKLKSQEIIETIRNDTKREKTIFSIG